MKIKRFFAPDMRRAIQQVRSEHGPDAFILSSATVEGGVELISAVDYDEALISQLVSTGGGAGGNANARGGTGADIDPGSEPEQAPASRAERTKSAGTHDTAEGEAHAATPPRRAAAGPGRPTIEWSQDPALRRLQGELDGLKAMLREQFTQLSWADLKTFDPERAALLRRVSGLGLNPALAERLARDIRNPRDAAAAWRDVVMGMARRLRVANEDPLDGGGILALVGPTGVGKTTTIAKLAARHCLRHGADSLGLITTDSFRIGAQRQLDAYGAILGVPVHRANTGAELKEKVRELRDRRLVLVDTAGLAPRDCRVVASLQQLDSCPPLRRYLVLPANMQEAVMRQAIDSFGGASLAGVVLTKTDEAAGLGAAVSALIESSLPVTWVSGGQRVPEDLSVARAVHLVRWAMEWREEASAEHGLLAGAVGARLSAVEVARA